MANVVTKLLPKPGGYRATRMGDGLTPIALATTASSPPAGPTGCGPDAVMMRRQAKTAAYLITQPISFNGLDVSADEVLVATIDVGIHAAPN